MRSVLTVTTRVATAPQLALDTAYDIVAVPAATPVTTPVALTDALAVAEELQVPPPTELVRVVVVPAHIVAVPFIIPAQPTVCALSPLANNKAVVSNRPEKRLLKSVPVESEDGAPVRASLFVTLFLVWGHKHTELFQKGQNIFGKA